jgi:hypothetical protein
MEYSFDAAEQMWAYHRMLAAGARVSRFQSRLAQGKIHPDDPDSFEGLFLRAAGQRPGER